MNIIEKLEDPNYVLEETDYNDVTAFYYALGERIDNIIKILLDYDPEWKEYGGTWNFEWTIEGSYIDVTGEYGGCSRGCCDPSTYSEIIPLSILSDINLKENLIVKKQEADELVVQERNKKLSAKILREEVEEKETYEKLKKKYD